MAEETSEKRRGQGFWTSVPGILTAIAGLITATATLLGVLFAAGVLHAPSHDPSRATGNDQPLPTPSFQGARKQGILVVRNGETASLDTGSSGGILGDFELFLDRDSGKASIAQLFNGVHFS